MTCPVCGGKVTVVNSVSDEEGVYRRRKCLDPECGHAFYTTEIESGNADYLELTAAKSRRSKEKRRARDRALRKN